MENGVIDIGYTVGARYYSACTIYTVPPGVSVYDIYNKSRKEKAIKV